MHLCQSEPVATESKFAKHTGNHSAVSAKLKTFTPRETDVLTLLHMGMKVVEIAAALSVCTSTVHNHTQRILLVLTCPQPLRGCRPGL